MKFTCASDVKLDESRSCNLILSFSGPFVVDTCKKALYGDSVIHVLHAVLTTSDHLF